MLMYQQHSYVLTERSSQVVVVFSFSEDRISTKHIPGPAASDFLMHLHISQPDTHLHIINGMHHIIS